MLTIPFEELKQLKFADRHIRKAAAFAEHAAPLILDSGTSHLLEFCSGSGLASMLLAYNHPALSVELFDLLIPRNGRNLLKLWTHLSATYHKSDIREPIADLHNGFALALHACGSLADRIVQIAVEKQLPFAIMPCCHARNPPSYQLLNAPDRRLQMYDDSTEYQDLLRMQWAIEHGYDCTITLVDPKITKKNRIILGTLSNTSQETTEALSE